MSRYQTALSVLCIMTAASGLFALVRRFLSGSDAWVWGATALSFLLAWVAIFILRRRDLEVKRLSDEPLIKMVFAPRGVTLVPVESRHSDAYFLENIARASERRGLKVRNALPRWFGARFAAPQVELDWRGSDDRIWDHVRNELDKGEPISLWQFIEALEAGYLTTLSEAELYRYYMGNR